MLNYNYGCVQCRNNKERKIVYKRLKDELGSKPNCSIWYERNNVLYEYQSTRKEQMLI